MFVLKQKPQSNGDDGWWISDLEGGDPSRTLLLKNAKRYKTKKGARCARTYFEKRYSHVRKIDLEINNVQ